MSLLFPTNPTIGDLYQSGSSSVYEWTGTYWKIKGGGNAGLEINGNPQNLNYNLTIPANYNALLVGDVSVNEGFTITVGNNSVLKVLDI